MARDLLRDLIFIVFIACFIYSVHNAALKLMARTKSVKSRRLFASEMDFPTVTACPLYDSETFLNSSTDENAQMASLEEQFVLAIVSNTYYTAANSSGMVSRVVYPNTHSSLPHSCVRVTIETPMKPGLHNPIQLILNSTGIYFWYITLHDKYHMVGNGIGAYFGNAFSTLKPSDDPDGTKVGWFLTAMSDVTMINDDDYRCDDSGSPVNLEMCLLRYLESTIGCQLPYSNNTENRPHPVCNESETHALFKEYGNAIDGGEKDIFLISGCLSSCRRKEFSLEKVEVDDIRPKPSLALNPPSQPDIIPGTTMVIIFYAGTMYNEYTQYLSYDENNFIADFGGYLGLLLGSSLLTFYDLFKRWITALWRCIKGRHNQHQDSITDIEVPNE